MRGGLAAGLMLVALGCSARRGPRDVAVPQSVAPPAVPDGSLAPQRTVRDGVYTDEQSRRGEAVYFASCALCHKPAMTGLEVVPPLVGEAFLSRWNTRTAGDLFEWIRKSMPFGNTPKLSDREYADVLAYILSRNGFRAGDAEIVPDFATMAEIHMESDRHLPPGNTFETIKPGQLMGSRMINREEEVSFSVPSGWVVDDRAPMGIRHDASGASFAVFFDDLVSLQGDLLRVTGENVAPDADMAVRMHRLTLRDSLGCDYVLVEEKRRQIGRVGFREIVLDTAPADGEHRRVRDFVAWYRSRAYVLRWMVPAPRAKEAEGYLTEILGSLNLKERG